jgi:acyl-CoA thioesterase-1
MENNSIEGVFMKRATGKLIIMILILALSGCEDATIPSNPPQETGPLVCFGDSLTEGYGASKPSVVDKTKSYPAFLQNKVKITIINAGISGDTASGGLKRVKEDVLAENPQMVIILLGANDFLNLKPRPASETKKDLQAIINKVKTDSRKIYLASFIGDDAWEASYLETFPAILISDRIALLADYKKMYAELCSENTDIGEISNIWKGIGRNQMSDLIHPNAEGYSIMADNIFADIKPYLAEKNLLK